MPRCEICNRVSATCELLRKPSGPVCKDKSACARRVRANQSTIDERSKAA